MKSKTGTITLYLFLFSIIFYSTLFSQRSFRQNHQKQIFTNTIKAAPDISPGFVFSQIYSLADSPYFHTVYISVADTTTIKDRDGDGVVDSLDKCPDEKGTVQYDGCPVPDSDNDGIADDSDNCPTVAGLIKYKGCPPSDKDGDKINDEDDKCPNVAGVARYNGCPVGDKDKDGINDDDDKCINVAGTISNAGCPEIKKAHHFSAKVRRNKN